MPGDTIYVTEMSRFSRSLQDLISSCETLMKKQIGVVFLKERIEIGTDGLSPMNKFIFQLFGAFNVGDSVYKLIYKKYYFKNTDNKGYTTESKELSRIKGIRITGRPGLAFKIEDTAKDRRSQVTYLNDTGVIEFYDTETAVILLNFLGYHLDEMTLNEG